MTTILTTNEAYNILTQVQTQFKNIKGTGVYNNSINNEYIKLEALSLESAPNTPSIYIPLLTYSPKQTDQEGYESSLTVECFGFVSNETEPVKEATKLASDMERALMADENLNGMVYNLSLNFEVAGSDGLGVVHLVITCNFETEK